MRKMKILLILSLAGGVYLATVNPDVLPQSMADWIKGMEHTAEETYRDFTENPSHMIYGRGSGDADASDAVILTRGRVVKVLDGDSLIIKLESGEKVESRLHGIDAPEWNQPHGKAAERALAWKVLWRKVNVAIQDEDQYGRKVVRIRKGDSDINLDMVCAGHAWWYSRYAPGADDLETCHNAAKQQRVGLWKSDNAVPPWEWRR